MFQGLIEAATAMPAETGASGDVLFDLGMMFSTGRSGMVDLVAAHKWFNLAALKGRVEAVELGPRRIAFVREEVEAWIDSRIASRPARVAA